MSRGGQEITDWTEARDRGVDHRGGGAWEGLGVGENSVGGVRIRKSG